MKKKTTSIIVHEYENVFGIHSNSRVESVKPLYRVCYCRLPNSKDVYTIVDKKFRLGRGFYETVLETPTKHQIESLPSYDKWKDRQQGKLVFSIDSLNAREEFKELKEKGECWKDMVDKFVDDTKEGKSSVMVDVVKSLIIPIPRVLFDYQKYNNHAIILSRTKTGKSVSFQRIEGYSPKQDPSVAGMLGSVEKDNVTTIQGTLNGSGLAVYDEFPEWGDPIVNHLLNYLELGETTRDLVTPILCRGNRALVFLGNYDTFTEDDFLKNVRGLATGKALDRVGSRFAHIVFQELKTVEPQYSDYEFVVYMRKLIQSTLNQYERRIVWIMKSAEKWFVERDSDYKSKIDDLACCLRGHRVKMFLEGCKVHTSRLKMGALKKAIVENLDLVVLCYSRDLKKAIVEEAKRNYEQFKVYNLGSFDNFVYDKKEKFRKLFGEGLTRKQIISELHISKRAFFYWKKQLELGSKNGD